MTRLFGPGKPKRLFGDGKANPAYMEWGRKLMDTEDNLDGLRVKLAIFYTAAPDIYLEYWARILDMWIVWRGLIKIEGTEC